MIIFDIGANMGLFSEFLLKTKETNMTVFAFEPNSRMFASKLLSLEQAYGKRFVYVPCALGDYTGEAEFFVDDFFGGHLGSLRQANILGEWSKSLVEEISNRSVNLRSSYVKILSIAEIGDRFDIDTIDLLKIDTQGTDIDILQQFLSNYTIKNCIVEVSSSSEKSVQQYLKGDNGIQRLATLLARFELNIYALQPANDDLFEYNVFAGRNHVEFMNLFNSLEIFESPTFRRYRRVRGVGEPQAPLLNRTVHYVRAQLRKSRRRKRVN